MTDQPTLSLYNHLATDKQIDLTLADGLLRLQEYTFMVEDERMRSNTGRSAQLNQILIINGSLIPNRLRMIIVKEPLGF